MQPVKLTGKQGESFERVLRFSDRTTKLPRDISGWIFSMDVRTHAGSEVILSAAIAARNQMTDKGAADIAIAIPEGLLPRTYKYDLRVVISGKTKYYIEGDLLVEPSITKA